MAKARDIYRRMRSVDNTKKITRTMEMVSTAKLRRAQNRVVDARPYSAALSEVIGRLATPALAELQPLLRQPERARRAAVILLTSNRGLCGAFNTNLIRTAVTLLADLEEAGTETELHVYGNKAISYFRFRGVPVASARNDLPDRPENVDAKGVIDAIARRFVERELDAAYLVHAEFRNMVSTPPRARRLLPVAVEEKTGPQPFYILDPSAEEILSRLLPLYVTNTTLSALLETSAAEHAARRTAMKNATDNAEEMVKTYTQLYNRTRQASITQEILEVIGGSQGMG
jgi:F-type H+-transporting ATPase subunit gamma